MPENAHCEICGKRIEPRGSTELVAVMGGYGYVHEACLKDYPTGHPASCLCDGCICADCGERKHEGKCSNQRKRMAQGTEVTRYDEAFAAIAAGYVSGERSTGQFISTRGGVLTFGEEQLPGNQICAVVLDYVQERTYYTEKFNADREAMLPPVCYAFHRNGDPEPIAPHPSMQADLNYFKPQHHECQGCPMNNWGTADTGRGKACAERRRLALLPAGYYTQKRGSRDFDLHYIEDPKHYESADIAYLKLSVTSVKEWARYVTQLSSSLRLPPLAVVTRIYIEPDPKTQFKIKFELIEQLPDTLFEIIMKRHEEAKAGIIFGYPPPSGEVEPAAPTSIRR